MLANIDRLGRRMDELGLDALVATCYENVFYLTGVGSVTLEVLPNGGACFAVVTRERLAHPHLITSRCDLDQSLDAVTELDGVLGYGRFFRERAESAELSGRMASLRELAGRPAAATPLDALVTTLRAVGISQGRLAVDEYGVSAGFVQALADALPDAHVTATGAEVFRWARKVKTESELARIAASAAVTEAGIAAAVARVRAGVTEIDLVREFDRTVAGLGARTKFTLIKFGGDAVGGQTRPTGTPLRPGTGIWFDVGCVLDGYWSDMARVCSFGAPAPKLATYYAAVRAGVDAAREQAVPGMSGKELFDLTLDAVRAAGIGHYRRQNVGHGIGVELYDQVLVTPDNAELLEPGTVVNIETPYHEFGFGAVQVEDPFVVGEDGNRWLSTSDQELFVVE